MDMEGITLRPATQDDSDYAYNLKKLALGECVTQTYGWDEDEQRGLHQRRFHPSATQIIVHGDLDIGLLAIDPHSDHIHLRQMFISPEAQSCGIGSQLVKQILKDADQQHLPVRLRVLKVNHRARTFYERFGFSVVGETNTHHQMEYCP